MQYLQASKQNTQLYPFLIEEYLENFKEIEIDGICDGKEVWVSGIIEQIEPLGIHSGDSRCIFPSFSIKKHIEKRIIETSKMIALQLKILGLFNIQFAVKDSAIYIIEINPRASRIIPYLSKAFGISLAGVATKAVLGISLKKQGMFDIQKPNGYFMKKPVFSEILHKGTISLGPEMLSTGETMYIGTSFDQLIKKSKGYLNTPIRLQTLYV